MKILIAAALAISLTACGGSSSDEAPIVTPEPVPPIIEPVPVDECEVNNFGCDVYIEPIDLIVKPIEGECLITPILSNPYGSTATVHLKDTCTNLTWIQPSEYVDTVEPFTAFNLDEATMLQVNDIAEYSLSFHAEVQAYRNGEYNNYVREMHNAFVYSEDKITVSSWTVLTDGTTSTVKADILYYTSELTDIRLTVSDGEAKITCHLTDVVAASCMIGNQSYHISERQIRDMPRYTDITEDYAIVMWTYIKEALFL
ncbi:MAG: hypothetical protein MJK15_02490 [Colwellia sp.]|nr:hypothetical protein [Colwellia sp.]